MKHIIIALSIAALLLAGCTKDNSRCGLAAQKNAQECMGIAESVWNQE